MENALEDIVTFGPELIGSGWLDVQQRQLSNGRSQEYRWTSARPKATFNFIGYDHAMVDVTIDVVAIASPNVVTALTIDMDGQRVSHEFETTDGGHPMFIKFRARRDADKAVSVVSLRSSRTWRPKDVYPGATDGRELSIAVCQARIIGVAETNNGGSIVE